MLVPGDLLFVPAEIEHRVEGTDRSSVHVTFACAQEGDGPLVVAPAGSARCADGSLARTLAALEVGPRTTVERIAGSQPSPVSTRAPAPDSTWGIASCGARRPGAIWSTTWRRRTEPFSVRRRWSNRPEALRLVRRLVAEGALVPR